MSDLVTALLVLFMGMLGAIRAWELFSGWADS